MSWFTKPTTACEAGGKLALASEVVGEEKNLLLIIKLSRTLMNHVKIGVRHED